MKFPRYTNVIKNIRQPMEYQFIGIKPNSAINRIIIFFSVSIRILLCFCEKLNKHVSTPLISTTIIFRCDQYRIITYLPGIKRVRAARENAKSTAAVTLRLIQNGKRINFPKITKNCLPRLRGKCGK